MRAKFGPTIDEQLLRQISQVRAREDSLRHIAKSWAESGFDKLSDRTKADIIVLQLEQAGIPVTGGRIHSLLQFPDKPLMIRPGLTVTLNAVGKLQIREEILPPVPIWVNLRESADHCAQFSGGTVRWDFKLHWREIYKLPGAGMMLDSTRVGDWALLRHPQEGDRVRLSGRTSARPLMDVLARNKIPREKRDRVVVATTQKGEIFWVEGLRIVEDFKLTEKTYDALQWQWARDHTS
jgi:tRNA(Ile)-lysidine synthetase-like protein